MDLNKTRLKIAKFLGRVHIDEKYLYLDNWSYIHFIAGIILGLLFNIRVMIILVLLWEVFELIVISIGSKFFRLENLIDLVWDIIIPILGGIIVLG